MPRLPLKLASLEVLRFSRSPRVLVVLGSLVGRAVLAADQLFHAGGFVGGSQAVPWW